MNEGSGWSAIILVEVVMIFGGAIAFYFWQMSSLKRDREALRLKREAEAAAAAKAALATQSAVVPALASPRGESSSETD
jgi:hypothetical protein